MKKSIEKCIQCGKELRKVTFISYVNEYNEREKLYWEGYKCSNCWQIFNKFKEISLLPLSDHTVVEGERSKCRNCGAWKHINPSNIIDRKGKFWHVPYFHHECLRCAVMSSIEKRYQLNWKINNDFILDSICKKDAKAAVNFCYYHKDHLLLLATNGEHHRDVVLREYGEPKVYFDWFVRGIYFRDKNRIYLRMHENEDLLYETEKMLKFLGMPRNVSAVWGEMAAYELKEELKRL